MQRVWEESPSGLHKGLFPETSRFFDMEPTNYIKINNGKVTARLDVVFYKEDGITYAYAPSLDLVGYDTHVEGAKRSFEIVLNEYLKYGIENNTLSEDLTRHGWLSSREEEFDSPQFAVILQKSKQLQRVVNNNYRKVSRRFSYNVC